jgi:hypothetical protein
MTEGRPPYARLLASTERGRGLLRQMDDTCTIPIINKPAAARSLDGGAQEIFALTADARDFYVLGCGVIGERRGGSDWRTSPATL